MQITMSYGKAGLPVALPDDWDVTIIRKKPMPVLPDPTGAVREAFSNPAGSSPLREEAHGCRSACIAICDNTRPVPNGIILPVLVRELIEAGIEAEHITVLIATGFHSPNEGEQMREVVGDDWVLGAVRIENHFARRDAEHVHLGTTGRGTPVSIDRRFVEADLRIVVGLVEPHLMAGYSGGRKVITPGLAGHETISTIHSARFMEHPRVTNCILDGNILHEEQLEVADMVGRVLSVNAVIDDERRISFVNFGDVRESHLEAVDYFRRFGEVAVGRRFKTVLTSGAGHPLDRNYYQTIKGMVGALDALEPGGDLFIVSECSEGMGSPEYIEAQRRLIGKGVDGFMQELQAKRCADIDEWQTEMQLRAMRLGTVHIYTHGLSDADLALTGVNPVASIEDALCRSVEASGDKRIAVIPEGPYVVPRFRPGT